MADINATYGDREIMEDALLTQKHLTGLYNTAAGESAGAGLQSELLTLLGEEQKLGLEIFQEMSKRGWYPTQPADEQKLQKAKEQFSNTNS